VAGWEILYLYRARLRARLVLVQELLAVLGIAVGVALLFASQVASTSLDGSIRQLTEGIVGDANLQLLARDPRGFQEQLLGEVRHLPGVNGAEPVLEARATVIGPAGRRAVELLASDPRGAHLGTSLLQRFTAAPLRTLRVLALPVPVAQAIGVDSLQSVGLELGARRLTALLAAKLDAGDIGALVQSPVAIAPLAYAQEATGMQGRVTRILVRTAPGREREVRGELSTLAAGGPLNVEPADFDAQLFGSAAAPIGQSEELFSAISALVGFMFAFNAMLVTAHLRRALVETLRRRGATRTMTVQVLLFDVLVLGVLGTLLGLALGEALSMLVFRAQPGYLAFAFAVGEQRIVTSQSVALAAGAGLLAACVGVLAPLHDVLAQRIRPARSATRGTRARLLRGRARGALRLALGATCMGITTAILLARPQAAILGSVTLVAALLLLLPFAFDAILAGFEALQRPLYAASCRIAIVELRSRRSRMRSLAIAATGAVAVFGSVAIEGARSNLLRGLDTSAREIDANAAVWVSPQSETNPFTTIPFDGAAAHKLTRLPGVRAVGVYRGGFLDWGDRRVWVLAPPLTAAHPIPASELVRGELGPATAAIRGSGWAVISQALAAAHHLRVGERFTLPSPHPTLFRVAALSTNLAWPPGAIVLGAEDYVRAWGSTDPSADQVMLAPGASPAAVRGEIQRALGATGLVVETAAERMQSNYATTRQSLSRLGQIGTLVLIAAVLAMAGAMGSMIWQRRPQLAYIKRQGYKRGVLWRALLCESAMLLGAGCSLGAVFGIYGQLLLSHALASVTGFPIVFSVGGLVAFWSFALVSAAAVAILALPGYLAVRVRPTTVSIV
jgi:putative ABC transport system permease protein